MIVFVWFAEEGVVMLPYDVLCADKCGQAVGSF